MHWPVLGLESAYYACVCLHVYICIVCVCVTHASQEVLLPEDAAVLVADEGVDALVLVLGLALA